MSPVRARRIEQLRKMREVMLAYLKVKVDDEDYHATADAAMDLRDIDSEIKGLERE